MSAEITDEMVEVAAQRLTDAERVYFGPNVYAPHIATMLARAALEAAAPAIQEAVAYRIASKLNALSAERAQADDMNASRHFKQAADAAVRVAKGGW